VNGCAGIFLEGTNDHIGIIDAQRRLGQVGDFMFCGDIQPLDILRRFHDPNTIRRFSQCANDFIVISWPMSTMVYFFFAKRMASECTLVTSGQVAST